jgi:hypothetical protein
MAILRDVLSPTVGAPQFAVASRRRRMTDPNFYEEEQQQQPGSPTSNNLFEQLNSKIADQSLTGGNFSASIDRIAGRPAPPALEPSARIRQADMQMVQPDNFKTFYEMLGSINQRGQEMLGAAQAQAAYKRQAEQQRLMQQQIAGFKLPSLQQGSGGSYGSGVGNIPSNPAANFRFAQQIAPNFGWGAGELAAWYTLGMKESGWRNTAQNPTSTAYGIGQFLNSTWKGVGMTKTSDPAQQVEAMARYIRNRYGTPSKALAFHRANNWY